VAFQQPGFVHSMLHEAPQPSSEADSGPESCWRRHKVMANVEGDLDVDTEVLA
jgi:hypothetical protein